jgi:hypothetical protein
MALVSHCRNVLMGEIRKDALEFPRPAQGLAELEETEDGRNGVSDASIYGIGVGCVTTPEDAKTPYKECDQGPLGAFIPALVSGWHATCSYRCRTIN